MKLSRVGIVQTPGWLLPKMGIFQIRNCSSQKLSRGGIFLDGYSPWQELSGWSFVQDGNGPNRNCQVCVELSKLGLLHGFYLFHSVAIEVLWKEIFKRLLFYIFYHNFSFFHFRNFRAWNCRCFKVNKKTNFFL